MTEEAEAELRRVQQDAANLSGSADRAFKARDSMVRKMVKAKKLTKAEAGRILGVSRQRIDQIMNAK